MLSVSVSQQSLWITTVVSIHATQSNSHKSMQSKANHVLWQISTSPHNSRNMSERSHELRCPCWFIFPPSFDFLAFKSLTSLTLQYLDVSPLKVSTLTLTLIRFPTSQISSLGLLRSTVTCLRANHCGLASLSQLLLCDTLHSLEVKLDLLFNASYSFEISCYPGW